MDYRHLGQSGLKVSEIAHGNWITHGSQVEEEEAAAACVRAEEISAALRAAGELGLDRIVSNQPQYNMLWRVIEAEVVPLCEKKGIGQIVWSPIAQGVLTGKYAPGDAPPPSSRATDPGGSGFMRQLLRDDVLTFGFCSDRRC